MRYRKVAGALVATALVFGATTASVTATAQPGAMASGATLMAPNQADEEFVSMMIPHHYQALVMSQMAPTRSSDSTVLALADRIDVEQGLEIMMMQNWQSWNGLEVTNAEQAYQQMLQNPEMLEQMGMATQEELDDLSASTGTAFDVLFLELMIPHHQGAIDMIVNFLPNSSDFILQDWAYEMLNTQYVQIVEMEAILADKT